MFEENHGWIGYTDQVNHYLNVVGADRDVEGKFIITGEESARPTTFMGAGVEVVVPGNAYYLKDGVPVNLSSGLRTTSYGIGVIVI